MLRECWLFIKACHIVCFKTDFLPSSQAVTGSRPFQNSMIISWQRHKTRVNQWSITTESSIIFCCLVAEQLENLKTILVCAFKEFPACGIGDSLFSHATNLALVCRSVTLFQTDISQQLSDGLPWNFLETFIVPRGWILMTLVNACLFL